MKKSILSQKPNEISQRYIARFPLKLSSLKSHKTAVKFSWISIYTKNSLISASKFVKLFFQLVINIFVIDDQKSSHKDVDDDD